MNDIELSYEKIMDYFRCPLLYKFRHILNLKRGKESEAKLYRTSMHKVVMYFYYSIMNGKTPSKEQLMSKWFKEYKKDLQTIEDILFTGEAKSSGNPNIEGLKTVNKFYDQETALTFLPIVVDTDVVVQIGNYRVKVTLELVREIKEKDFSLIELVRFSTSKFRSTDFEVDNDLNLTLQSYAFRQLFQTKEDRLVLHYVRLGKKHVTFRGEDDYNKLIAIVNNVGDAIKEERFHPIVSRSCKQCSFKDLCNKYKF